MNIKRCLLIASAMLVIDWTLGALHAERVISLWPFLVFNFPFGLPFVWFESHWAGSNYQVGGQIVNEVWSFVAFFFSVCAQAGLYSVLFGYCHRNKRKQTLPGTVLNKR